MALCACSHAREIHWQDAASIAGGTAACLVEGCACPNYQGAPVEEQFQQVARAEELARAHHAAMGPAMRLEPELANVAVLAWEAMPEGRRRVMVAVMRMLIDEGVIE